VAWYPTCAVIHGAWVCSDAASRHRHHHVDMTTRHSDDTREQRRRVAALARADAFRHLGWAEVAAAFRARLRSAMARARFDTEQTRSSETASVGAQTDARRPRGDTRALAADFREAHEPTRASTDRDGSATRVDAPSRTPSNREAISIAEQGASPEVEGQVRRADLLLGGLAEAADSWEDTTDYEVDVARRRLLEQDGLEFALRAELELDGDRLAILLTDLEPIDELLFAARAGEVLSAWELWGVHESLRAGIRLADILERASETLASERGTPAAPFEALLERCAPRADEGSHAVDGDGPRRLRVPRDLAQELQRCLESTSEGPRIASAASPGLARARADLEGRRRRLVQRAEGLLKRTDLGAVLQDRYWTEREGRVVLPIRADGVGALRDDGGILHGSSASGQTAFVEPRELVGDNNALREAEARLRHEERLVMEALSRRIAAVAHGLADLQRALIEIGGLLARLDLAASWGGLTPELLVIPRAPSTSTDETQADVPQQGPRLEFRGLEHPLMLLARHDVVPNDFVLDVGSALIVSGPNAGGKTVVLKAVGLCVLLARAGLRVPTATPARVPVFRHVVTDVGDDQSIANDLSTFTAQLEHMQRAFTLARHDGAGTLVLMDEIAVGTAPEQGAALARAAVERWVSDGATVVVTTHYERLKALAAMPPPDAAGRGRGRFLNAAVGFDLARMAPTFRLHLGVPGTSSAIAVARRLGVDEDVLREAEAAIGDEGNRIEALLQAVEHERGALQREREVLEQERRRLSREDLRLAELSRRIEARELAGKVRAWQAASIELRGLEGDLKAQRKALRREDPAPDTTARASAEAARARQALATHAEPRPVAATPPAQLVVGQRVRIVASGLEGEVLTVRGEKVTVQLPNLRTTVSPRELELAPEPAKRGRTRPAQAQPIVSFRNRGEDHFGPDAKPVNPSIDDLLDLRGLRVDEVGGKLDHFLAEALVRDRDVVVVVHGHGSGALRKFVREHLRALDLVERTRPGFAQEGGEGVTVVWLRG
jgi:DNA mismatch repair protein MutS2